MVFSGSPVPVGLPVSAAVAYLNVVLFHTPATRRVDMASTAAQSGDQHELLVDPVENKVVVPCLVKLPKHVIVNLV
jgi:hypothetical protein